MSDETPKPTPKRVRPPRKKPEAAAPPIIETATVDLSTPPPVPAVAIPKARTIPACPDAPVKSTEMKDWIYTHLPLEMAKSIYGGLNHTPTR